MSLIPKEQFDAFDNLYGRKLSQEEVAEISHNLFGLLKVLIEIDQQNKLTAKYEKTDDFRGTDNTNQTA